MAIDLDDAVRALNAQNLTPAERHRKQLEYIKAGQIASGTAKGGVWDALGALSDSFQSSFVSAFAGDAKTLDYMFDSDITKDAEESLRNIAEGINREKSARAQIAAQKKFIEEEKVTPYHTERSLGDAWSDIYSYVDLAGSGAGSIAAMMVSGFGLKTVAKAGLKQMLKKGMKREADRLQKMNKEWGYEKAQEEAQKSLIDKVKKYDSALGMASYGTAETAIVSGSVGQSIEEEIMRAPAEILNESPRFKEMYWELRDANPDLKSDTVHNLTRTKLAREAGIEGAKTVAIPSFMLGSVAGKYIEDAIAGRLSQSVVRNFATLEAIELPTEAAQGATEQYVQNKIYKEYADQSRDVWEDVAEAAVREGLGVGLGVAPLSAVGAVSAANREKAKAQGTDPGAAPDLAVTEEAGVEDDLSDVMEMEPDTPAGTDTVTDDQAAAATEQEVDLDLDLDEQAVAEMEAETRTPDQPKPETTGVKEPETEVGPRAPETEPVTPTDTGTEAGPRAPAAAEQAVEEVEQVTPEAPAEPTPVQVALTDLPETSDVATPIATAIATPGVGATAADPSGVAVPVADLSRQDLNKVGKAVGLKTAKSRKNLEGAARAASLIANTNVDEASPELVDSQLRAADQILRDPPKTPADNPPQRLKKVQQQLAENARDAANLQARREEIEAGVEAGTFGLQDFLDLPPAERLAFGDIGRAIRRKNMFEGTTDEDIERMVEEMGEEEVPEPTETEAGPRAPEPERPAEPEPEPTEEVQPEEEVTTPEPTETEAGPRAPEPTPEEVTTPEPTEEVQKDEPTSEIVPEKEEPVEHESVDAIREFFAKAEAKERVMLSGTRMNGQPAKTRTVTFEEGADGEYKLSEGKKRHVVKMHNGRMTLFAGGRVKTMIIDSAATAPKTRKVVADKEGNINGTLRRLWQLFAKQKATPTEADLLIKKIEKAVSKGEHIKAVDIPADATPGTRRMVNYLMSNVPTFFEWAGPMAGGGRADWQYSFKDALKKVINGEPMQRSKLTTVEEIQDLVSTYTGLMQEMRDLFNGAKTVDEVQDRYVAHEFDAQQYKSEVKDAKENGRQQIYERRIDYQDDSWAKQYTNLLPRRKLGANATFKQARSLRAQENITEDGLNFKRERFDLAMLNEMRSGFPDWRKGKDVTGQQILDTFGFANITYGEYVGSTAEEGKISEAQLYRNMVYDAFMDLSYITGIEARAMGHNIWLSVGALGQGKKFAAFYSNGWTAIDLRDDNAEDMKEILDDNRVSYGEDEDINSLRNKVQKVIKRKNAKVAQVKVLHFNRTTGDGTLAHEWAHSLDYRLPGMARGASQELKNKMSLSSAYQVVRELINDFVKDTDTDMSEEQREQQLRSEITNTLNWNEYRFRTETSYYQNAKAIKPADYWANDKELFARAVEARIYDYMSANDEFNPFLQGNQPAEGTGQNPFTGYAGTPYPEGEERHHFNEMLDNIFAGLSVDEDGNIEDKADRSKFGTNAQFNVMKQGILDSLDDMIAQAAEDRLDFQLALQDESVDDGLDAEMKKLTDADIENLVNSSEPDPDTRKPKKKPKIKRGPKEPGTGATGPAEPKTVNKRDKAKGVFEDNGIDPGLADDLFDIMEGKSPLDDDPDPDVRFSVDEGEPGVDPAVYEKLVKKFSAIYHDQKMQGTHSPADFIKVVKAATGNDKRFNPYLIQFVKEIKNGTIDYTQYLDSDRAGAYASAKGNADRESPATADDREGVGADDRAEDAVGTGDGAEPGVTDGEARDRRAGGTDQYERDVEFAQLTPAEQAERLFQETGLESSAVESLPRAVVESTKAQVNRKPTSPPGEYEVEYSAPVSQAENQYLAMQSLQEELGVPIDNYLAEQLEYKSVDQMREALMSLQVEAAAAAIYQINQGKSVIIGDQTGVGKGRQAAAVIRWAERHGKVPVFITQKAALYTDMYNDLQESGTDFIKPYLTGSNQGIKKKKKDESAPDEWMFKQSNTDKSNAEIAKSGTLPGDSNAMFTTYDQLKSDKRRKALNALVEGGNAVLIMDESHEAAGPGSGINEYLSNLIPDADGAMFLSATFAKRPEHLAFYFNTDLSDAVDNMAQLIEALKNGGTQLQEVMSQALTRGGQLFRREISYEGIEIKTKFDKANEARDREYADSITGYVRDLIETNFKVVEDLEKNFSDPMQVANRLFQNGDIDQETLDIIADQYKDDILATKRSEKKLSVNYTPINNIIHNLMGNLMVAAKADGAVNEILSAIRNDMKPIIGLDKTNASILEQYRRANDLDAGADVSDFNWATMIKLYADKSYNVSISFKGRDNWEAKGAVNSTDVDDQGLVEELNTVVDDAKQGLAYVDLPLSPIDYIMQTAEARAKKELGRTIKLDEVTGRQNGGFGIDYTSAKPKLKRLPKQNPVDIVESFNGGTSENPIKGGLDGLIINRSGSTGISAHSSVKHGDQRERHMIVAEPAPDINVFLQMLGRIYRTGMAPKDNGAQTMPYYTLLGSSIPADVRNIAMTNAKMESLNAQTSANKEGVTSIDVVDFINKYGDEVVKKWIEANPIFSDLYPNWAEKLKENKLAYWASARIGFLPFSVQEEFFETVTDNYLAYIEELNQRGENDLAQTSHNWRAIPREEIKLAEKIGDGGGFKSGSYLVRWVIEKEFKPLRGEQVQELVNENKAEVKPPPEDVSEMVTRIQELDESNQERINKAADLAPEAMGVYQAALKYLTGEADEFPTRFDGMFKEMQSPDLIEKAKQDNRKGQLESAIGAVKIAYNKARSKRTFLEMTEKFQVGHIVAYPDKSSEKTVNATIINMYWDSKREDPHGLGNIQVELALTGGGKARMSSNMATLNNLEVDTVSGKRGFDVVNATPDLDEYVKYHETLGDTSATGEAWIAVGNPLLAASELNQRGSYVRFTDYKGRTLQGIKIPDTIVEKEGIESTYKGNVEIPNADIMVNFFKDNYFGDFPTERGFATRYGTTRITVDKQDNKMITVRFRNSDGMEKFNDETLQTILKKGGIATNTDDNFSWFTVPRTDAAPYLTEVMRRSRFVVSAGDKIWLKDYMTLPEPLQAQDSTAVPYTEADTIEYEGGVTATRGKYTSAAGKTFNGFYLSGIAEDKVSRINRLSTKMRNDEGGFFVFEDKFAPGKEAEKVLGSPLTISKSSGTSFSLGGIARGTKKAQVEEVLKGLGTKLRGLTSVVQSENDLPADIKSKIRTRKLYGRVRGVYHKGRIYIVSDNLYTPEQAEAVFLHEAIGHLGLRQLLGKELNSLLNRVAMRYPAEMKAIAQRYNINLNTKSGRMEAAEELLAHIAEQNLNPSLIQRLINLMQKFLRSIGFNMPITKSEIVSLLQKARETVEQDGFSTEVALDTGDARFSVKPSTMDADVKKTPDETVMQALRDGQPVDAAFRAIWNVAEATQLPKLVRMTSAASLRGAMNFYGQRMKWAKPFVDHMAKGLIDRYGLDEEFRKLEVQVYAKEAEIVNEVRDIINELEMQNITQEESNELYEILTNEAPTTEQWEGISEPIRKRIEELGQEAVDYGLISQEAYDEHKGAYLHRVYMKYEKDKSGMEKWAEKLVGSRKPRIQGDETIQRGLIVGVPIKRLLSEIGIERGDLIKDGKGVTIYALEKMSDNGAKVVRRTFSLGKPVKPDDSYNVMEYKVRFVKGDTVRIHRDWTKEERKAMGEITDARYVLGKTFGLFAKDLSNGMFFQEIAANPAWTWDGEGEPDDYADGQEALRLGIATGYEWVKVPTTRVHPKSRTPRYGALAGKFVRAEIYQHLNQIQKMQVPGFWKSIMTQFKLNKTARNPVVHFNNIMSNLVLMDMADVRMSDLWMGIRELQKKGPLYEEARQHGAFGASFAERELQNDVLDKLLDDLQGIAGAKPVGLEDVFRSMDNLPMNKQIAFMMKIADAAWNGFDVKGRKVGLRQFDKKMLDYYQNEDMWFRMATYIRRRGQGMDPAEAGISARDQFLNYDITAPWINAAKAYALPFISYTYRAVPIVARSMMNRPWKMAKYFTIAYAINAIGYALSGGDEDRERKSLRDEVSGRLWIGTERLLRMPWNDEKGNPYFWDVRRLIPVGDVFDLNQYHAALPIIPAPLMPSGPLSMFFEFALNKTSFFGEQIVDWEADDGVIATQKTFDWLWKSYGPSAPWIPYSYYADKLMIAGRGGRDRLGREYSIPEALASSVGIKLARHDVSYGMALKALEIERKVKAIRHHLNFLEKDYWQGKIQKSTYEGLKNRYIRQLQRHEEKAKELFGGG